VEQNSLGPQPSEVPPDSEPVALYVRVSSADQNCQLQLRELGDYAARQHLRVGVYEDVMSGAQGRRPSLNRLTTEAAEDGRSLIIGRTRAGQMRYRRDFDAGRVDKTVHSRSG
jgi:predicted site-specific integrase-resolvase